MSRWASRLVERPRLALGLAGLLSLAGGIAWFTMPREEDPRLAERFGVVVAVFAGADAEQIERLVVDPIEEQLARVEDVKTVRTTIRSNAAVFRIELGDGVDNTQLAWDRVQDALEDAHRDMPDGARPPTLDHETNETEAVLLAITGPQDVLQLADEARALESALLDVPHVQRVVISGDPDAQITVALPDTTAARLGLDAAGLAARLNGRNQTVPGGSIRVGARQVELRPSSELESVEAVRETPITLASGATVPLSSVADVRRMQREPVRERARVDGQTAVVVGVVPSQNIDSVRFGESVREATAAFQATHPELEIEEIAYQPGQVEARLGELGTSLLVGIGIVALVLFLTMGVRLGVVVASVVPLVTFASLAVYALGGGILHQIAVAALVLALGLLVDNAIVVAEAIQRRLDEGEDRRDAVRGAVRELATPLAAATATTLAAFVPMLLAPGTSGEFTRAIPIVVMLTLSASYLYAIAVTPLLAGWVLRPQATSGPGWVDRGAARIAGVSVRHPLLTLVAVGLVIAGSASFALGVGFNFFPASDRAQLVVSVGLPEGAHLDATDETARRLERALMDRADVSQVATFVGRSSPSFYYNLPREPRAPHLAQLVVTAHDEAAVPAIQRFVRDFALRMPDATVVPRALEQGPPVDAPVEVRLIGHDLAALHLASEEVRRIVRSTEHAIDVRSDHGPGTPRLAFSVDEADAARRGVSSVEVAGALLASTHGRALSTYRGGDDPIPIVVRSPEAERRDAASLDAVAVRDVPVGAVTRRALRFGPAVVRHLDRRRTVSVLAEVQPGATYASIVAEITPQLEALDLPDGVRWELGGAAQSSGDANAGLGSGAPLGAVLLIAILLATFDSIRKVGVVLVTAPLAVMGIWPGLLLAGLPFGFVALLGAIALIGIVVNGAIVLIDLTEQRQGEGASMAEALTDAVTRRTRPILLTTATTVAGLTPLLFSDSTLWPPMASAMISGLIVATALTLFAVPALMRLLFRDPSPKAPTVALAAVALTLGLAAGNPTAEAQLLSHEEGGVTSAEVAVRALENDPSQVAVDASIAAAQTRVTQVWAGLLPTLRMSGRYTRLSEQENDPIVAGLGGGEETDALVSRLDDPAAQALWTGSLSQQRALGQAGIPVIVDQFVFEATLDVPISELFFTLVPQLEAAERGVDVERAAREVAQQTTALRAREVYYGLARARALEALATSRVADAQETLRVVEAAAELGAARESEVLGARARLAEVESFVWQAQAGTEAAAEAVRVLAAIEGPISLGEDLEQALPAPAALARLQEEAWTGRAEVRVLRRAMGVSERVQAAAEGARYPALRVRLGAQAANPNARFVPPRASFDATWDVSVLLAWSPNAAVAAEARASEASAARARLTAQLEQLRRGLRLEVTGAWSQDRAAQAVLVGVRAQRDASAEALRSRQAERREGTATTQEVLDAEASATAARLTWVNAVIGARLARARLAYASAGAVPWP